VVSYTQLISRYYQRTRASTLRVSIELREVSVLILYYPCGSVRDQVTGRKSPDRNRNVVDREDHVHLNVLSYFMQGMVYENGDRPGSASPFLACYSLLQLHLSSPLSCFEPSSFNFGPAVPCHHSLFYCQLLDASTQRFPHSYAWFPRYNLCHHGEYPGRVFLSIFSTSHAYRTSDNSDISHASSTTSIADTSPQ
jgi:hypothetical protein